MSDNDLKRLKVGDMASENFDDEEPLKFQEEEFIAPKKEERQMKWQHEFDLIKKAGFNFNYECDDFIKVEESENHSVCFRKNSNESPHSFIDQWNDNFVKLPFSNFNIDQHNNKIWTVITNTLTVLASTMNKEKDADVILIEHAIIKYNSHYKNRWNFRTLEYFFTQELKENDARQIMQQLLPRMIKLALDLPRLIVKAIPILKAGSSHSISLTQHQCASILANAFFCTFPEPTRKHMPFINFDSIFNQSMYERNISTVKLEKLKCIFHYFQRVTNKMPDGVITFSRVHVTDSEYPKFRDSRKHPRKPLISLTGTIEDCIGAVQVDFANKYLGGGVLTYGCVQEEIRFLICPELITALLFTECLDPNESVMIRGCERFSSYTGYASTFEWLEDYVDNTGRDEYNRIYTDLVAIDALKYRYYKTQFAESKVVRELRKSYAGFRSQLCSNSNKYPLIATGNWGCGAFNGDRQLKFLIQVMAATEANRDLIYYTFNNESTQKQLEQLMAMIEREKLTVGDLYKLINDYDEEIYNLKSSHAQNFNMYEYMKTKFEHKS